MTLHSLMVFYVIPIDFPQVVTMLTATSPIHPSSKWGLVPNQWRFTNVEQTNIGVMCPSNRNRIFFSIVLFDERLQWWGLQHSAHHSPDFARPHASSSPPPWCFPQTVPTHGASVQLGFTPSLPAAGHGPPRHAFRPGWSCRAEPRWRDVQPGRRTYDQYSFCRK